MLRLFDPLVLAQLLWQQCCLAKPNFPYMALSMSDLLSKKGKAKAISAVANSAPVWIVAKPDFKFSSPMDLKGKRIAVSLAPGTSNTLLLRLLGQNGLNPKTDVTISEVQNGSELGPLLAGRADAAVVYEPQADRG